MPGQNHPDLTDEQAAEWGAVVDRLPVDWFLRETHGLVAQYCGHVRTTRPPRFFSRADDSIDARGYTRGADQPRVPRLAMPQRSERFARSLAGLAQPPGSGG
jgi:hypothetical protein